VYRTDTKDVADLLDVPAGDFVPRRYRPGNLGTWSGHLAFANDLVSALRPSLVVELGAHHGESYFAFCQSVAENGLDCLCYAVDTWLGEAHAGYYGEDVMNDVREHNETYYKSFSYLLRTSFDGARTQFTNDTIDLLHLDGLHTYDAVRHDFENWLPKVKPGGIVLLHDIAVRHADFGVWQLWEQVAAEFPDTFAFHHSWGLGVMRKPGGKGASNPFLDLLFASPPRIQERLRRHYVIYASHLENLLSPKENQRGDEPNIAHVQVYPCESEGYSEDTSITRRAEFQQWNTLTFDFPTGSRGGPLRIDPADCPCVIELGQISVALEPSGEVLWRGEGAAALRQLAYSGSAVLLPREDKCLLFSHGADPRLQLPPGTETAGAITVSISLRIDRRFDAVSEIIAKSSHGAIERSGAEISRLESGLQSERTVRIAMEQSLSWRATKPLRACMKLLTK
jgi:hypothetical protein